MKKEGIITLIIIIVILIGEWAMQTYTHKQLGNVEEKLTELKEEIINLGDKGAEESETSEGTQENKNRANKLLEKTNQIYDEWEEKNEILSYYLEHDELEKVNTQMVLIKGYLEVGEIEDSVPGIEEGLYILEHIRKKEQFSLKNIL